MEVKNEGVFSLREVRKKPPEKHCLSGGLGLDGISTKEDRERNTDKVCLGDSNELDMAEVYVHSFIHSFSIYFTDGSLEPGTLLANKIKSLLSWILHSNMERLEKNKCIIYQLCNIKLGKGRGSSGIGLLC